MKKSTKFVIVSVLVLACVISFMLLSSGRWIKSPKKYIELFGESGFTVVKTSSRTEYFISTKSMNEFADYMTWYTMQRPVIYWYRDSQYGLTFYYIDIQGRSIAFMPRVW